MEELARGAEAVIKTDGKVVYKERIPKEYRIKIIDDRIRKFRTKREAKVLTKFQELGLNAPKLITIDKFTIEMEYIKGDRLVDVFDKESIKFATEVGKLVAEMHNNHIIHGDLTTSNLIVGEKIYLIDFGLSLFSYKIEDMAVDLHLFRQALESKHYRVYEKAYEAFLTSYKTHKKESEKVLARLEKVEKRGRYKHK